MHALPPYLRFPVHPSSMLERAVYTHSLTGQENRRRKGAAMFVWPGHCAVTPRHDTLKVKFARERDVNAMSTRFFIPWHTSTVATEPPLLKRHTTWPTPDRLVL